MYNRPAGGILLLEAIVRVLPSDLVKAIDSLFGPRTHDIDDGRIKPHHRAKVETLLALLDRVPTELIALRVEELTELLNCRAELSIALGLWAQGAQMAVAGVVGKDPVERIRRLLLTCSDYLPPPKPEVPFITDDAIRSGIETEIHNAWASFHAAAWLSAMTVAAAAMEAILLWKLNQKNPGQSLNRSRLVELIEKAHKAGLISDQTAQIAHAARDARNLVHPGKVAETGKASSKALALTTMAGLYRVIEDLSLPRP
jgi:hypothetical protein